MRLPFRRRGGLLKGDAERLAWIFGSSRSGSTWLLRMLSDIEGVVPVDDPHLGHHLGVWRPIPLAWATAAEPPELKTLLEVKRKEPGYFFSERHRDAWWEPLRELISARFEAQRRELGSDLKGRPTYLVKEPGSHVAGLLTELFPESKLIFLLRDGRDVVDSWLDAYRPGSWAIPGGAFPVARSGRLALIRWLASVWVYRTEEVRRAYEAHDPASRILVRYEEMRERPAATLKRIAALLDFDLGEGELDRIAARHSFERISSSGRGPRRAVRSATPGAWRKNTSPAERLAMAEVMGPMLAAVGYEAPTSTSSRETMWPG